MTGRHRRAVAAAAALVLTTTTAGCTDREADVEARASNAAAGNATQAPVAGGNDEHADLPTPAPAPTWDDTSRSAALSVAETAMQAFARPTLEHDRWWAELAPLLSADARHAYQGTDPAEVPARAVTGRPVLTDEASPYLAPVRVPTDAGRYLVLLSRTGRGEPWLVERITPPTAPSQHR